MKQFNDLITLSKNSRGCYIIDTIKGCSVCGKDKPNGCYDDCYAKKIAKRYNIDFNNPVVRKTFDDNNQLYFLDFHDGKHISHIVNEIRNIDMPFVRIGEMGDPSENWEHTINVCHILSMAQKSIVIITKHWQVIPEKLLKSLKMIDLYINTSISAMDNSIEIKHRLNQYERLKPYCNSILRIVSCDFNIETPEGARMKIVQDALFNHTKTLDTVFRPSADNPLVKNGIIKVEKTGFLKTKMLASKINKNAYLGRCETCPDMCGLSL
jgi:hypothetical protein